MKMKKLIALAMVTVMVLSFAGCGAKTENSDTAASQETQEAEQPAEQQSAEEQVEGNPIKAYEGFYTDANGSGASINIVAADDVNGVTVDVGYPQEVSYVYWEITGTIKDNVITYEGASKFSMNWGDPDQEYVSEEQVYSDGTGSFEISSKGEFTWKDDKDDTGKGMVFVWDDEMNALFAEQMAQMENEEIIFDDEIQNPSMNWAGPYADMNKKERTMLIVSGDEGTSECTVYVTDAISPDKTISWLMYGELDIMTMVITYKDAVKKEYEYDAQGNVTSEETFYENGTGKFVIDDEVQEITWTDDMEDAGNGSLFGFTYDYGEEGAGEFWTGEPAVEAR